MANEYNKSANESENLEDSNLVELGLDEGSYETREEILAKIVKEEWKQLHSFIPNMQNDILQSQCDILRQLFVQSILEIKKAKQNLEKIQAEHVYKSQKKGKIGHKLNTTPLGIKKMQYWGKS